VSDTTTAVTTAATHSVTALDIYKLLSGKITKFTDQDMERYQVWLMSIGWRSLPWQPGRYDWWLEPGGGNSWPFSEACWLAAEVEAAKMLRALGWLAPHRYGATCIGSLCRPPGTWVRHGEFEGSTLRGSGGRWFRLPAAFRRAVLDEQSRGRR
jgi:hypothetical protein